MISILNKEDCCGCNACYSVCAHRSISMQSDFEGFVYPVVDEYTCTECGLCERVCPVINQSDSRIPIGTYAVKSLDEEIRKQSSSGGVFSHLAESVIEAGGVVFGAKFNEKWEVVHSYSETISGLAAFRGSKYVQSNIGDSFVHVKTFLKQGRFVLFSGTPCHIAGLKKYLRKEYSNLLAVDFICHGVPSPLVWNKYINTIAKIENISNVSFRNKEEGWKQYRFVVTPCSINDDVPFNEPSTENAYMKGFLRDLYCRPSCHACPSKDLKSGSDLTIADFWGIERLLPDFDDNKGVSLVIVNSKAGNDAYNVLSMQSIEVDFDLATRSNQSLFISAQKHKKRDLFFSLLEKKEIVPLIEKMLRPSLKQQLRLFLGRISRLIIKRKK